LPADAETEPVSVGCLDLEVSDSWTAQVFHVVDQLSEWDQFVHRQYVRWGARTLGLTDEDRALLKQHAALRKGRGWSRGFEQAFYTEASIDVAAKNALDRQQLTSEEATTEMRILQHFSPMLEVLREPGAKRIATFRRRLRGETTRIEPLVEKLCRFAETFKPVLISLWLVFNPEEGSGGGGANGGRLVMEVRSSPIRCAS
jgi:hypothetical protein